MKIPVGIGPSIDLSIAGEDTLGLSGVILGQTGVIVDLSWVLMSQKYVIVGPTVVILDLHWAVVRQSWVIVDLFGS